ncbi:MULTISPECIES: S9 family peptidase [Pseudonocardia]|uniref:Prolyl tripeptidyl peptidase n=2 Tax=Pseudonocardia TaxID=1847 RepID=A0A1Y2N0L2_PSEAH|nr:MULTISPECIES: S9 family peptidase [Pseudonocardia]OSY40709.1 Prolyl tripeptidyl peptidase precursor [Pseudonocardia autotrophica]TDN71984.1 dipeptidyl aminopeptidase/acylaminoacyl peptidase [Pseudonocardia autotrophica]BBG02671.1 putative peptidase [Pseudonocardia autotrophica]GEC24730.1 putative peptidase [Pseudonocardia saturnea]
MTAADTAPGTRPRLVEVDEFFADPAFVVPSISPDGSRIAYLAPHLGRRNIWVRGVDQTHADAVPVTADTRRGITMYHWTDDPRWLLYLQDTDGNEDWHLYRVDLDRVGGDDPAPAVDLTPMGPGSRVFGVEPLPSVPGNVLVTMNLQVETIDVHRIDVATGEVVLHHHEADPLAATLLDRGGAPAFLIATEEDGTVAVSGIDRTTGTPRLLRRMGGAEYPLSVQPQLVTPDGGGLLVGSFRDGDDLALVRIDRETGEETVVAAVEGRSLDIMGIMAPGVLPPAVYTHRGTGEAIAARFVDDRPHIEVLDPDFAPVYAELAALSEGVLGTISSDVSGRRWIVTFTHDREPGVTWFYDHYTGERRRLFQPFPDLDPADLAPMTPVRFPARDGLELPGYLTLPVGVEPRNLPTVLLVHGGPWSQDYWTYNPEVQLLANRGYAVLQVNYRGSLGYGRRHLTAAVGEYGRAMQDDLIDAVDWAVAQGYADPARIGISGVSYGGYAVLRAITVTPDLFAAAVDYVGVSDLVAALRALPPFTRRYNANSWYRYLGDPDVPEQEAELTARSPITMVDRIRTPLLVAQGANDVRVPQAQSDRIVASLRERGVPVEYLLAEDEGHGFENEGNRLRLYRAIERHLAEHLGGRCTAQPKDAR